MEAALRMGQYAAAPSELPTAGCSLVSGEEIVGSGGDSTWGLQGV